MIASTGLEVYNAVFKTSDKNNKFEVFTNNFDQFSYAPLKNGVAGILGFSDISSEDLQHEIRGPKFVKTCRILATEKNQTDGHYIIFMGYAQSSFRDIETYFRFVVG